MEKTEEEMLYCTYCGHAMNDYIESLKCPACGSDLEGEALRAMLGFKKYLERENLKCDGDKIIPLEKSVALELKIKHYIDAYNENVAYHQFQREMENMTISKMSKQIIVKRGKWGHTR